MQKHIRENGNVIYAYDPLDKILNNSNIKFNGKNNILFLAKKCILQKSSIIFGGDNALVFLGDSVTCANINLHSRCLFYGGNSNYYNPSGIRSFLLSERKNIIIGDNGLYSFNIWFRNADPHLIYDNKNNERINFTKSIYIGDHVWFGQDVGVTKGVFVASGTIIGAKSMLCKSCFSNTSNAGNPIKEIKNDIFWTGGCVHNWDEEKTKLHEKVVEERFKYTYNQDEFLSPKAIEAKLDSLNTAQEKLEFVYDAIYMNKNKNRFAYFKDMPYDIPLPKYESKFKLLKFEEIEPTPPKSITPPQPAQPTPQEQISSLKEEINKKDKAIKEFSDRLSAQEANLKSTNEILLKKDLEIKNLKINNQKAQNIKNHLSYKLGVALIQAHKQWYKGGYIKFIFEAIKIKKDHKSKR